MGIYINPRDDRDAFEKAEKIFAVGTVVSRDVFRAYIPGFNDTYGVALLDNGAFIAAGVAYCKEEAIAFSSVDDGRPVTFVLVPLSEIEKLDPHAAARTRECANHAQK